MDDKDQLFYQIYKQYHPIVFKIVLAILKDRQVAEDLVQDSFFALYIYGYGNFKETSKIKNWLIKTATYKAYDYLRRNRKIIPIAVEFFNERGSEENLYLKIEEEEMVTTLYRAIDSLSEEYKTILILYYFNQITQIDLAEILQIPLGTVKSRLNKARRLIKLYLAKEYESVAVNTGEEGLKT